MAASISAPTRIVGIATILILIENSKSFTELWTSPRARRNSFVEFGSSTSSASDHVGNNDTSVWKALLDRFQGDFDNYNQVLHDRKKGLLPREGGGHEHIHCSLVPVSETARLAAFYFDGVPGAIFRFRLYDLIPVDESTIDTVLYTLHPELERRLRRCPDPSSWPLFFEEFGVKGRVQLLPKCDVRWSWVLDPVQHDYALDEVPNGLHAVMVHGEALVESQMMPGQKILIKDQLSLWPDELWIHDRGFDPDTMRFIYGNQRGVPYRLERVTDIALNNGRTIVQEDLAWTLGPDFRSEGEYQDKMVAVGGGSRPTK
uniref:Uncharacterized protein n=1 Tax=Phaeodactylum tricornutum TaxID=2850 RepID=A0A8J9X5R1_PHATR